jgi:predicted MFS family arabinose efflux permease
MGLDKEVQPPNELGKIMTTHIAKNTTASILADRYKVIISGISAVILSVGVARFSYTPLLPVMTDETNLSNLAGGILATLNYVGYLAGALMVSRMHKVDHKYLLYRICLIAAVVSTFAMAWTQNQYLWGILRVLSGFTSVGGMLLAAGFVFDWLRKRGFQAELGLHFAGLGLGIVLTGVAAVAMQGHLNWAGQWEALGLLGILFAIPAWLWMPVPAQPTASQQPTASAPSRRWMNLVTLAYFCAGFGYVISATFIVAIIEAMPTFSGKGAWIWILMGLAAIPASFVWDRVAQVMGHTRALMLSFALQDISIVIPATMDAAVPNLVAAFLFGITVTGIVSLMLSFGRPSLSCQFIRGNGQVDCELRDIANRCPCNRWGDGSDDWRI